jgi:hypothetical protein
MRQNVARLHLLPSGGPFSSHKEAVFEFCYSNNIIGVGWYVGAPAVTPFTWNNYLTANYHDDISSVQGLYELSKGDLVWTRDRGGLYYIAEIRGKCEYRSSALHVAMDIVNMRRVELFQVSPRNVTVGVRNAFTPQTFQLITDDNLVDHTITIWRSIYN